MFDESLIWCKLFTGANSWCISNARFIETGEALLTFTSREGWGAHAGPTGLSFFLD